MDQSRVLIVEDERIVALDISDRLQRAGYEVMPAVSSGEAAINSCLAEKPPHLLLMDIRLDGELDGIDTASKLREIGHFPVVFLTAYSDEQSIVRAKAVEPYGYILKPVQDQDLLITVEMALSKAQLERKLYRQERRLECIVENIDTAVAMVAAGGQITVVNRAFLRLTGYDEIDELRGRAFDEVVQFSELTTGDDGGIRTSLQTRSGDVVPVEYSESDLGDEGRVISLTDISVRETYERELLRAAHEADENARSRARFLANVSHELRTPLNSIMGMTDLALDLAEDPTQKEYLGIVRDSSQTLFRLVSSILHYTRVDSSSEASESVRVDLLLFCEELTEAIAALRSNAAPRVCLRLEGRLPRFVHLDRKSVRQILLSLGGNAVKFTPGGHVVISVAADKHPEHLLFRIQDEGPGIPEHELSRIFEPFAQLNDESHRTEGGSGIGLSIAQSLAYRIGAEIDVQSAPGKGSEFRLQVPIELDSAADHPHDFSEIDGVSSAVILSDDDQLTDCLRSICRIRGIPIVGKTLGESAGGADLFIVDSASEAAMEQLRTFNPDSNTVILLVVDAQDESQRVLTVLPEELRQQVSVVSTPILPTTFYGTIAARTERIGKHTGSPDAASVDTDSPNAASVDTSDGTADLRQSADESSTAEVFGGIPGTPEPRRILLAEDEAVNRLVNRRVLERFGHDVETATDGNECIKLLSEKHFDLVLMDLRMPGVNGLEATSRIRSGEVPGVQAIPIVALTAYALESERAQCMDVGMNGFLGKPFSAVDLYNAVEYYAATPQQRPGMGVSGKVSAGDSGGTADLPAAVQEVLQEILVEADSERLKRLAVSVSAARRGNLVREGSSELLFRLALACRRGDCANAHDLAADLLNMAQEGEL